MVQKPCFKPGFKNTVGLGVLLVY